MSRKTGRIEARDLRPGDTFEYEYYTHTWRRGVPQPETRVKRDTVRADKTDNYNGILPWACWFVKGGVDIIRFETEVGQHNHHGYVELDADRVVVLVPMEALAQKVTEED